MKNLKRGKLKSEIAIPAQTQKSVLFYFCLIITQMRSTPAESRQLPLGELETTYTTG